ncbi:putative epoxide hydrolase [Madurella mycetomatis]|uniref:Epoxide hydrolase n=1 Tax=Madurella mycetomatis TaxID=100816 RepID=A0A175WG65_9PEZI|nr:putative epoxide hydrolase [Madurella mycetomatis]
MDSNKFGILPSTTQKGAVSPFTISIPDAEIDRLRALLTHSKIPSACYENAFPDGSRTLGLRRAWLVEAQRVWETEFNWRSREEQINAFPNFVARVPLHNTDHEINIHFLALFSSNPSATPVLLLHGWPGSPLEFLPFLEHALSAYPDTSSLPYHLIVPSLPGYAFSDAFPADKHYGMTEAAHAMDHLITSVLGLSGYVIQGGDIGSYIGRMMTAKFGGCKGALLNFIPLPPPEGFDVAKDTNETEKKGLQRAEWFNSHASAYVRMHSTRPATVGLALGSSPLALLAWVAEKFLDWTDPRSFPEDGELPDGGKYSRRLMDEVLTSVSLYWFTGRAHTSLYAYRELLPAPGEPSKSVPGPENQIREPKVLGISYFPFEIVPVPRKWVEASENLVFWRDHSVGGHFAALEQPRVLFEDLEAFVAGFASQGWS